MKHLTLFLAAGVLLTMQSSASAWSTIKFSAGINFHMEHGPNHARCHGHCYGPACGIPMSYGAPLSYDAPVAYGSAMPVQQGATAPPVNSFGQAPGAYAGGYSGFYPASYQTYPGYYNPYSYGR